jgi:uncharacterized SAM-binding protein YcdF (DUF218 family)
MTWFITNLFSAFLLPPLNLLIIAAIGLWLWKRRPLFARILLTVSVALLWLLSTPFIAETLLHQLEDKPLAVDIRQADAIVVLGGGTYFHAPEYGTDTVNEYSLLRLRYAAKLYRESGYPILLSGGKPAGNALSEAQQMKRVLVEEFNVPVTWTEDSSDNTLESALACRQLLQANNVKRIALVTHASHMPRAVEAFKAAGFEVIPAPTGYTTRYQIDLLAFVPNAIALRDSKIFMHELIGILWYRLKS